jgi:hypothetical protein
VTYVCWSALILWCWYSLLFWVWTLPLCLYCLHVILFPFLLSQVSPCSLMFWLVLRSCRTWSGGLIQCCVLSLQISLDYTNTDVIHVLCTMFNWLTCLSYHTFPHSHGILQTSETFSPKSSFTDLTMWELYLACMCTLFTLIFRVTCWYCMMLTITAVKRLPLSVSYIHKKVYPAVMSILSKGLNFNHMPNPKSTIREDMRGK